MKIFNTIFIIFITFQLNGQIVNIPDSNFKLAIIEAGFDTNNDSEIQDSEALEVANLNVNGRSITSIEGIQSFLNLKTFICSDNLIGSMDVSMLSLLEFLSASENLISEINLPQTEKLNIVDLRDNMLTELVIGNNINLSSLNCSQNPITTLDLKPYVNLEKLFCFKCELSNLDLSQNLELTTLVTNDNIFFDYLLPNSDKLEEFICSDNNLSNLDLSPYTNLKRLNCDGNLLEELDINTNVVLEQLNCANNNIQNLDCSFSDQFNSIDCQENDIKRLNLKNGVDELFLEFSSNPDLNFICADSTQIPTVTVLASNSGYTNLTISTDCATVVSSEIILDAFSKVDLFPNPTAESCTIKSEIGFGNIWLTSIEGILIESISLDQTTFKYDLKLHDLPSQMYIVSLRLGDRISHHKILKQ